jgi:hypothetical protein
VNVSIRSYDLSGDQAAELILALNGDAEKREKWLRQLRKWVAYRDLKLKILGLTENWLKAFGLKKGVHVGREDWQSDEENLLDWVYYQMEYMSGLTWDEATKSVIINKYASSRPLLRDEETKELLEFLTLEIGKDTVYNELTAHPPARC